MFHVKHPEPATVDADTPSARLRADVLNVRKRLHTAARCKDLGLGNGADLNWLTAMEREIERRLEYLDSDAARNHTQARR
ncbi:MAG: hypothetical protein B7Z62_00235 [Deltaproteobacteria bacterium 37-65-8]|nr:MAG: hypothetical protein B7Z62_00235 [Deltaproteobacteria bacterium 37-65-8]